MKPSDMTGAAKVDQGLGSEAMPAIGGISAPLASLAPRRPFARALRVMHVINSMAVGGTERVLLRVTAGLQEGFDHRVCCIRSYDPGFVCRSLRQEQIMALDLPQARFSFFVPHLARAIRACKPDVVHSRNWGAIEAVFAARLAGVPVVIHSEHGYEGESFSQTPLRHRWMRRLACSVADAFFTVSRELRDFHAAQAGVRPSRIRVLHNGVDSQIFAPNPAARARIRKAYGIAPEDFVVGAVGRMVRIKDYATLLRAAGILAQHQLRFRLVMVGDGPELPGLVALSETLPGVRTNLLPLGKRDNVQELLAAMDVFVQTSLCEGMSNTALEAMSAGLPALLTDVGGNPELVKEGQTGWLFRPGDAGHLAQLLLRLAADPQLRVGAGLAARRHVEQMFSLERMLENYRALYVELAQKRKVDLTPASALGAASPCASGQI